jgi:hypothetical protein
VIFDHYLKALAVGDMVYRAKLTHRRGSPYIYIAEVTRIENGKLYLDNSKSPIVYPDRLVLK